jgi:hypothetical protein
MFLRIGDYLLPKQTPCSAITCKTPIAKPTYSSIESTTFTVISDSIADIKKIERGGIAIFIKKEA